MKRIIFLLLLITLFLVGCTPQMTNPPAEEDKEPDLDEKYNVKELIPDGNFSDGMTVLSQKDHKNGDRITELGSFTYTDSTQKPKWSLAQWDIRHRYGKRI